MTPENTAAVLEVDFRFALAGPPALLAVGAGVERLLGWPAEDFLSGKVALRERIHPDDADIAEQLFLPVAEPAAGTCNLRLRQANGRIRCVKALHAKRVEDGRSVLDLKLQDAKSLPRTLDDAATTANFRAMMENTDDFIYFKDRNHVFTGASQTLVRLCESTEHWTDLLGLTDYDVFPEAYADIYYRLEKQVFAGSAVAQEVQETLAKDGTPGWVDNRKYPIRDASGAIVGLFGIARDVTEHVVAGKARKEALDFLTQVASSVPGIMYAFRARQDGTFDFPYISPRVQIFNLTPQVLAENAAPIFALVHPDDLNSIYASIRESMALLTLWRSQFRIRVPSGEYRWYEGQSTPQRQTDGSTLWHGYLTDIQMHKDAEERIRLMAQHDSLTGLPNRALFDDLVQAALAAGQRDRMQHALLFLDLDYFKPVNDSFGHRVGDLLLQEVTHRLRAAVRESDTPARIGGDEFVVLLRRIQREEDALLVGEKIRAALNQPFLIEGHCLQISASIGIALFPRHGTSVLELERKADEAMYLSKERGRNTVTLAAAPAPSLQGAAGA